MTLKFKHFDTRLNQWIHTDGNPNNPDSILTEELDNTLLEVYFPHQDFSFGHIDERTTALDLYNHPEGHVLLLSSKTRLLYGPPECLGTIEKLCPDRKDRGAYGSIFLGSCTNAITKELNLLVVDDETGENGNILPDGIAWRQVGDCHGKISPELAREMSGTVEHTIQHRLGIPDQFRLAKGTLAPKDLSQLAYTDPDTRVDLIVPTSSFKGGDKQDNPIQPGLHKVTIWLGEKERAQRGKIATSQAHASFPQGIKDFLPTLAGQAQELQQIQNDPRLLAEYYCHKYEQRQAAGGAEKEADSTNDHFIYRLIKADLAGHGQLLETQKVTNELKRFLRQEWRDIAIGKTITFDRAMIIPSKDLKHGEICVPWLPEGEEILNFRSPLLNSNGMCVSVNKWVEDALTPKDTYLAGTIAVNDEDHQRIQARIAALQAQGIETEEIDPLETESERQGRDYDGDCIGVALAKDYPNLTAEAKRRNLPENAYAPVTKEAKASFYREDGTQPPFEEIAIFMSDSISVGVINNHATALEALESEIDILGEQGTLTQKADYVQQVGRHYQKLLAQEHDSNQPQPIKATYRERIVEIARIAQSQLTPASLDRALGLNRSIYHDMVGEAGYQNQLAVDIFKSNRAPDMDAIRDNNRLLHRIPNYIRDKKQGGIYVHQALEVEGVSPVELLVQQANTYFRQSALIARPTEQFRHFFPESYTPAQYNQALLAKAEFDRLFNRASAAKEKLKQETGPVLQVQTQSGASLEITNLLKFNHPQGFTAKALNLKLSANPQKHVHHRLLALAQVAGETDAGGNPLYQRLGTVCEISRQTLGLTAGMTTNKAQVRLAAPLTDRQVKLLFEQAYDCAREFAAGIPAEARRAIAAATWHACTTPESGKQGGRRKGERGRGGAGEKVKTNISHLESRNQARIAYKISNFAFAAFPEEILEQTQQLQFTEFLVAGLSQHNEVPDSLWREGQTVNLEVRAEAGERCWYVADPKTGEWNKFGLASPKGAQLPIGTKVQGIITGDLIATATLHLNHPQVRQPITFGKVGDFDLAGHQFNGERVKVTLAAYQPEPKPILKLGNQEIGELDGGSIAMLQGANRLQEGTALEVTLNTLGQNSGTHTLATTARGNTLRVNRQALVGGFKQHRFNGEKATVEVGFKQAKPAMAVKVEIDGREKIAGIFTPNHKASKQALMEAGLFRDGATFTAAIASNITLAKIAIEPQSVQYPEPGNWQVQPSQAVQLDPTAQHLLDSLKRQPSLLHRLHQDWQLPNGQTQNLPTLRLAVDAQVAQATANWLERVGIPHSLLNPDDPSLEPERQRGYLVLAMIEGDVPPPARGQLRQHCGSPLDGNLTDLATLSPYHQHLETIPTLTAARLGELEQQYPHFYADAPWQIPQRQLPSLLAQENYEWQLEDGSFTPPTPTFRISLPPSKLAATEGWLKQQGIPWARAADAKDIEAESQLGYAVLRFPQADLPGHLQQTLQDRLGTPLDADTLSGSYYQRLAAIAQGMPEPMAENESVGAQALRPQEEIPDGQVIISGKPVSMAFPLKLHGENNPIPVSTTIDAMRGHGRCHTTRTYEPYQAYGFQEGDVALAVSADKQVAFRVGQQYRITPEMIDDPQYRGQWAAQEKHSARELDSFRSKPEVWGLAMEPLGDYIDGKIVPFPLAEASLKPLTPAAKTNPLADLPPLNPAVAPHTLKDVAMAGVATQFIGKSAAPPETPSSTRNYEQAWGDRANTGNYTRDDTIMVSGSGPWRGVTQAQIEAAFEEHYQPLLARAIAAQASFVVGNAQGTDRLVQEYLKANGYELSDSGQGYLGATPQNAPASVREPWESKMLSLAFKGLKSNLVNASEEMQTATFGEDQFRAIFHVPTDTLYVVDEQSHRGTIYQAKRGEPAQVNEFTEEEKRSFLQLSQVKQNSQGYNPVLQQDSSKEQILLD